MKARAQVVPLSAEYSSSYWCDAGLMLDQMPRTSTVLSLMMS
jgi:hypothetical protein